MNHGAIIREIGSGPRAGAKRDLPSVCRPRRVEALSRGDLLTVSGGRKRLDEHIPLAALRGDVGHLAQHAALVRAFGGASGLRDRRSFEAAVARPAATFAGEDLYDDLAAKAAALMHSLVLNHPFVDGNKRVGVAAAELFLSCNRHLPERDRRRARNTHTRRGTGND